VEGGGRGLTRDTIPKFAWRDSLDHKKT